MGTHFSIMNKDVRVLDFSIVRDLYTLNFIMNTIYKSNQIPLSIKTKFKDLRTWIESRYILACRNDTLNFFKNLGIDTVEDFITITKCVSLNDTYWVKPVQSKISWKAVSPYRNPINKNISDFSFNNKLCTKNIGSSPDFSTDGNFPKCWKRINEQIFLLKAGTSGYKKAGNEAYSEVFAYQLAKFLNLDCIEYTLTQYKGIDTSKCKLICDENTGIISLRQYINNSSTDFKYLVEKFNDVFVHKMLIFDYLTCNVDRHFGNIWLFINNDTQKVSGFTPVGDNNLSCIPYYTEDEDLYYYINDIRVKDGRTWKELLLLTDKEIAKRIIHKASKFRFRPLGNIKADKRVEILNNMLQYQIKEAIKILGDK